MFAVYELNKDLKWEKIQNFENREEAECFKKAELRKNLNPIRVFELDCLQFPKGVDREEVVC